MLFQPRRPAAKLLFTGEPCKNGHLSPRYAKFGGCVECVKEANAKTKRSRDNRADLRAWVAKNREYSNARRRQYNMDNPERRMVSAAKKTAKIKGIPFNLSYKDISIPEFCPVLGLKLEQQSGVRTDASPSIDRIIPERGYVTGNVIVVSMRANRIKNDASVEELKLIANFYNSLASKD